MAKCAGLVLVTMALGAVMGGLGCTTGATPTGVAAGSDSSGSMPVTVSLTEPDPTLGEFVVMAEEPTEKTIAITLQLPATPNSEIVSGLFELDPNDLTWESAGTDAEVEAAQAAAFEFEVTGFVFSRTQPGGGCGAGDQYGPITVSVDDSGEVRRVSPVAMTLLPNTVQLIKDNNLAICLRVVSPMSGTVNIGALRYELTSGTVDEAP